MKMRTLGMISGCLLAAGCADGGPTDLENRNQLVGGTRIETRAVYPYPTFYTGAGERSRDVVRGQAEWQSLWERIWRQHQPLPPTPSVDFSREMVVAVAMGSRPTGGYTIAVDSAVATAAAIHVFVTERSPDGSCVTTQAFTAPVHAVALPADGREVRFHETAVTRDCR